MLTRKKTKERLNIRIDDQWYDLTNWRAAHPAGAHWIDAYKNSDATEARPMPPAVAPKPRVAVLRRRPEHARGPHNAAGR